MCRDVLFAIPITSNESSTGMNTCIHHPRSLKDTRPGRKKSHELTFLRSSKTEGWLYSPATNGDEQHSMLCFLPHSATARRFQRQVCNLAEVPWMPQRQAQWFFLGPFNIFQHSIQLLFDLAKTHGHVLIRCLCDERSSDMCRDVLFVIPITSNESSTGMNTCIHHPMSLTDTRPGRK